ncbi:hypothetical protein FB451DRAFT_1377648 [Mycena latifolia]|nr:hypothetical protein FB451DRAFT_1377648 [Mycena latifolia]
MSFPELAPVSPKFSFPDADVTFRSSDGVLFHLHRKNLEVCTEGFPPAEISTRGESVVDLSETSATLELLFQFIYPQRHPALDTPPFGVLDPPAEAAEKYQVFSAMNICHIRMRDMIQDHPVAVVVYAAKHDYPYLLSEVAPMMISMAPLEVIEMLPPYLILPWTRVLQLAVTLRSTFNPHYPSDVFYTNHSRCRQWAHLALACMARLATGITALRSLETVFDVSEFGTPQSCCGQDLRMWRDRIEAAIAGIPKFRTFL